MDKRGKKERAREFQGSVYYASSAEGSAPWLAAQAGDSRHRPSRAAPRLVQERVTRALSDHVTHVI